MPRLTALSFTVLTGCAAAAAPASTTISLTEHESVTVAPGAVLTYDSIADNRCPTDVHCVMAGKVVYSFTLKQEETLEHFTLTPAEPGYKSPVLGGKSILLADAAPPPKSQDTVTAHRVNLRIVAP
jgi:hypothetical protein